MTAVDRGALCTIRRSALGDQSKQIHSPVEEAHQSKDKQTDSKHTTHEPKTGRSEKKDKVQIVMEKGKWTKKGDKHTYKHIK